MTDERKSPCFIKVGGIQFGKGTPMQKVIDCIEERFKDENNEKKKEHDPHLQD